VICQ
jgi:hypothetical protein